MTRILQIQDQLGFVHSMPQTDASSIMRTVRIERPAEGQVNLVGLSIVAGPDAPGGQRVYEATATPYDRRLDPASPGGSGSLRKLKVVCDTLTVPTRWWLPECDVEISARRIVFENDGSIDTSPMPWTVAKAADASGGHPGRDGADGRSAGDITVLAAEVSVPAGSTRKRLIARGGDGQSGGLGLPGADGRDSPSNRLGITGSYSHRDYHIDSDVRTNVVVPLNKHGDHTIIGIRSKWKVAGVFERDDYLWGTTELPTDGSDAVAPGDAGNGGDGGRIYVNRSELIPLSDAREGRAGKAPREVKGGRAGHPAKCGHYDNLYYHCYNFNGILRLFSKDPYENDNSGSAEVNWKPHEAKAGGDRTAKAGRDGKSYEPEEARSPKGNTWLHPLIVPVALDFVRRAYLGEQREEARRMLEAYEPAFREGMPARARATEWTPDDEAYWLSVSLDLAATRQRLDAGLDYFGNPAGYAPLLSLAGSFRQYQIELDTALETLVFVGWLSAKQRKGELVRDASRIAAGLLTKENREAACQITQAEADVEAVRVRIAAVTTSESELLDKIGAIRTALTNKASGDLDRIADIKFAANLAAGVLQLVPYGQPVLGGLASMAADATDALDEEPEVVVAKVKDRIKTTAEAYKSVQKANKDLVKDAKDSANELAKAAGKSLTVDQIKALNETSAPAWKTAAKGIGPAFSHFKAAYEKGRVTRGQIDERLAKLAAADPEWKKLSLELGQLADQKAKLLADVSAMSQSIGQKFAFMAANSSAIERLDSQAASVAGQMLGAFAQHVVADMGLRAVMALTEALYDLVRAFESSRLESVQVDWSNESFLSELNRLIDAEPMDSWSERKVQDRIKTLKIAFQENLRAVRRRLTKGGGVSAATSKRDFTFDEDLGAERLAALNDGDWISIDTLDLDFVSPDRQHHLLAGLDALSVGFAEAGEDLPTTGDMEILIELDQVGVVRSGGELFGLRLNSPVTYVFTYHFAERAFTKAEPSDAAKDLLNIVLDDMDGKIRQRMTLPPAWGVMRAKIAFSGLRRRKTPTVRSIGFRAAIESQPAPRELRVLQVRSQDGFTPLRLESPETGEQLLLSGYFVLPTERARLRLSSADPKRPIRSWRVIKGGREQTSPSAALDLKMDVHAEVEALAAD